jgi:hypothetical protein
MLWVAAICGSVQLGASSAQLQHACECSGWQQADAACLCRAGVHAGAYLNCGLVNPCRLRLALSRACRPTLRGTHQPCSCYDGGWTEVHVHMHYITFCYITSADPAGRHAFQSTVAYATALAFIWGRVGVCAVIGSAAVSDSGFATAREPWSP